MNFPNVQVLRANSRSEFFGENLLFKRLVEITVEGSFLQLSASNGTPTHQDLNSLEGSLFGENVFFQQISVNGVDFGEGYVNNFNSSPDGDDVNDKKYTATIVIPEQNATNVSLEGGAQIENDFKYLNDFSESSTFTKGAGVKDSYSQTISLSVVPPTKSEGKTIAESIIQSFLDANSLTSLIEGQYQKSGIKKYYQQSYDKENNSYNITVNFDLYPRASGSNDEVFVIQNISIKYSEDGVLTATEAGECIGNSEGNVNQRADDAADKAKSLVGAALGNLSGAYDTATYGPLIATPISQSFTIITFEGKASYSVTYTTSEELIENSGFWNYTIKVDISDGGDVTGTEEGTIIGYGEKDKKNSKFTTALDLYGSKKGGIKSRIQNCTKDVDSFKLISKSLTHSENAGSVQYSETYSSNTAILEGQDFTKILANITKDYDRNLFSTFNIVNLKEIAQVQENLLENNTVTAVTINGKGGVKVGDYIGKAKTFIEKDEYVSNVSLDFSSSQRELTLNAVYFKMPS
jgi:hypothetical protein